MWQYNYLPSDDELAHYGVKGMRWGIRRSDPEARYRVKLAKRKAKVSGDAAYQKRMTDGERLKYAKGRVKIMGSKAQAVRSETTKFVSDTFKKEMGALFGSLVPAAGGLFGAGAAGAGFVSSLLVGGVTGGIGLAALTSAVVVNSAANGYRAMKNINAIKNVKTAKKK